MWRMRPGCGLVVLSLALAGAGVSASGQVQRSAMKVAPGYLGIDVRDVGDDQVVQLKLRDTKGAEIIRVDHDGPAGKMGLREHDVVVQMNGIVIEDKEQLRRLLHEFAPGRQVSLLIEREGMVVSVSAAMADRSQLERDAWEQHLGASISAPQAPTMAFPTGELSLVGSSASSAVPPPSRYSKSFLGTLLTSPTYTGAMLQVMMPQLAQFFGVPSGTGLLVRSVVESSPATLCGMRAGDVVTRADGHTLKTLGDWTKIVRQAKGKPVQVTMLRDHQERTLTLTPDVKRK